MATEDRQQNEDRQQKRSCLYDLGWIEQKGKWLDALRQFAGRQGERLDLAGMDSRMRAQVESGIAYVDVNNRKVEESRAAFIRLDTGIVAPKKKTGNTPRYVIIKFHRNQYGLWAGLDFEYGDEAVDNPEEKEATSKRDPFYADIYWRSGWQDELQDLAVEEPWDNEYGPGGRLLPYLRYTYRRLKLERDKIVKSNDGKWLAFNTGLVTRDNLEPIVAVCSDNAPRKPDWQFDRFVVWSEDAAEARDRLLMKRFGGMIPNKADWFRDIGTTILSRESIQEEWDLVEAEFAQLHYPSELLKALAIALGGEAALNNARALMRMEDANLPSEREMRVGTAGKILKELGDSDDVKMQAMEIVKRAFGIALRRLSWEVGTAVPMWDPSSDSFDFLLPLSFGEDPLRADIALKLEPISDKAGKVLFRPKSFLKLKAAYSNARNLRRPEAFWLRDYVEKR